MQRVDGNRYGESLRPFGAGLNVRVFLIAAVTFFCRSDDFKNPGGGLKTPGLAVTAFVAQVSRLRRNPKEVNLLSPAHARCLIPIRGAFSCLHNANPVLSLFMDCGPTAHASANLSLLCKPRVSRSSHLSMVWTHMQRMSRTFGEHWGGLANPRSWSVTRTADRLLRQLARTLV